MLIVISLSNFVKYSTVRVVLTSNSGLYPTKVSQNERFRTKNSKYKVNYNKYISIHINA